MLVSLLLSLFGLAMSLYTTMGCFAPQQYRDYLGTIVEQAYNSPPSLSDIYHEYGDRIYDGLHELRQLNKTRKSRMRGIDAMEYHRHETAQEGIVWIAQGDGGTLRFSYANTQLPVTQDASGRWYPALLVWNVDQVNVIFECPKIALLGSRLWLAHPSRVRVWNVYGELLSVGTYVRFDSDVSLQDHGMGHDCDDDDVDIMTPPRCFSASGVEETQTIQGQGQQRDRKECTS